ncbi:hypothetical protein SUDANB176_00149 [Streptomyces sp. enrichment culture]|uniref:hypothetical protein n=1 Tax=Streptomyces sp. enrichment culture TaxID=1795815 RepID=UPI003F560351
MTNTVSATFGHVNIPASYEETAVNRIATVLLAAALVVVFALLAAAAAGTLARLDGATYPAALMRAATTFAAVLTLAAAITGALAQLLS